ncbi:excisionase family DNA binding protein [Microbacterium resistens]|uniref:Excisionase family DNA binding protein n=1 Tax=Microbacterium resistens TaxID=156977 RepID=A0ABU1SEX3_9MICO|nr:helix-turn-helix domain-containing protein [Microbacterium resistens]MDR6868161.1 excisionase family DNA binding protein [Microbacterium resistens]
MATSTRDRLTELPDIATRPQVSEYTQVSVPTLARWAMEGKGPRVTKFGALARYRKADVLAWIEAQAQEANE